MNRFTLSAMCLGAGLASTALAQPGTPVYTGQINDCTTIDNRFRGGDGLFYWSVDAGCDIYQRDLYERPTAQTYRVVRNRFASNEAFEYLDITAAKWGWDSRFLYVAIDLYGRNHLTSDGARTPKGMIERYGFRFSTNPDGRNGVLVVADQPELKNAPKTRFGPLGTFAFKDTNADVGGAADSGPTGLFVTKSDNPDEEDGMNGYDRPVIADGKILGTERRVLWVRLDPNDRTVVEFALDYTALGYTQAQIEGLQYLDFEAVKGGPKDPQNYLWNDKYTKQEAGSPNRGSGGLSEFGTEGCQNIYEADTVRANLTDGGDFNGNGIIDPTDVKTFLDLLGAGSPAADLNGDGRTDALDAARMMERIG